MNINTLILRAEDEAEKIASSPGTVGWIFTFAMAVAAGFLIFDMVRRIRKVRYREEIAQQLAEEQAAKAKPTKKAKA